MYDETCLKQIITFGCGEKVQVETILDDYCRAMFDVCLRSILRSLVTLTLAVVTLNYLLDLNFPY